MFGMYHFKRFVDDEYNREESMQWNRNIPLLFQNNCEGRAMEIEAFYLNALFDGRKLCFPDQDMKHAGSLESTQKARNASSNSYASFVPSKLPACFISLSEPR